MKAFQEFLQTPEGLEEARRALVARECRWHGHSWEIVETSATGPSPVVYCCPGCELPNAAATFMIDRLRKALARCAEASPSAAAIVEEALYGNRV